MKRLIAIVTVVMLAGCGSGKADKTTGAVTTDKGCIMSSDVYRASSDGANLYWEAWGFDPANSACWARLKEVANGVTLGDAGSVTVHFMDMDVDKMIMPEGTLYGSEAVQRKVVATYTLLSSGKYLYTDDPLGYGVYVEPEGNPSGLTQLR